MANAIGKYLMIVITGNLSINQHSLYFKQIVNFHKIFKI